MDESAIRSYVGAFEGVRVMVASAADGSPEIAWGDTFFFYDPDDRPAARRFPFVTIVTKDYGDFDNASNLDRAGVFRLNIGLGHETYAGMFGTPVEHDYAAIDRLFPHPVYRAQNWVSVVNPSHETFESIKPLLIEAYERAIDRHRSPVDAEGWA